MPAPDPATEPVAVDLRDYVDFDLDAATGRRVFTTDVLAVDLLCLEPSQFIEPLAFPTADVIYTVLGGIAWVVTDEAEVTLLALQSLVVPATIPHAIRNDSPDPLLLHRVVSPPDEAPPSVEGPATEPTEVGVPERGSGLLERLRRGLGGAD